MWDGDDDHDGKGHRVRNLSKWKRFHFIKFHCESQFFFHYVHMLFTSTQIHWVDECEKDEGAKSSSLSHKTSLKLSDWNWKTLLIYKILEQRERKLLEPKVSFLFMLNKVEHSLHLRSPFFNSHTTLETKSQFPGARAQIVYQTI